MPVQMCSLLLNEHIAKGIYIINHLTNHLTYHLTQLCCAVPCCAVPCLKTKTAAVAAFTVCQIGLPVT